MSANGKHESSTNGDYTVGDETSYAHSEDGLGRSPADSPAGKTIIESLQEFSNAQFSNAAIVTQCGWRRRVAKRELRYLNMAARETAALKEAKDKLEKCVEELTWRMQIEKRLRTDLEEEKTQEIAKLQDTLRTMQTQVQEANVRVIKELEAAQKAIEEAPPVIKETPVINQDTEKINSLRAEVKSLKESLLLEREANEEARKAQAEAEVRNKELLKKVEASDRKVEQLQELVHIKHEGLKIHYYVRMNE
ncbi:hypothetical protein RIF29_15515 [Crotalaria pallida]|uniref:Uncharacterized protein n=1 Tax=Crotalaria pallida TaxID=3830 RepID=A0AAN9FLY5_CROPI